MSKKASQDVLAKRTSQADQVKKRLWVVTEVYYPETVSSGHYLTSIAEGMTDDFDVKVICGQPNYAARGTTAPRQESRNRVEIFRAASTTLDKNVLLFRLINMLTLGVSMFLKSLRYFRKGDKVLVVTAPPSLPFTTALASLIRGATYALLIHDCYPEILIAVGKFRERSIIVTLGHFFNRWLFKYANKIIVVGRDMNELLQRKTAGLDIPIVTIPNWADLDMIRPTSRETNELLAELGIQQRFVFMYAGNIGHPTDIETIVECAERLVPCERYHFVFIGSGAKTRWLKNAVSARHLINVSVLDPRPRNEQIVFLNACDVGLVSLVKKMWGMAMPSRTYNILAAGKPILAITEANSELARVIDEERVGWHVPPHDADRLYESIIEIYEQRATLAGMSERARSAAVAKYSLTDALQKYRSALR